MEKFSRKQTFDLFWLYVLEINTPISADTVRSDVTTKRFGVGQAKCRILRELSFNV